MSSGENHCARMEDDNECTVPYDDTVVLDTEEMDITYSVENEKSQLFDDYGGEIVVDSDDERVDETQDVKSMNGLFCGKIEKRQHLCTGLLWRKIRKDFMQSARPFDEETCHLTHWESKADPYPISAVTNCQHAVVNSDNIVAQAENQALVESNNIVNMESDRGFQSEEMSSGMEEMESKNIVKETLTRDALDEDKVTPTNIGATNGENDVPHVTSDHELAGVYSMESQEPEESSQSNALDFVDRYLSATNLNLPEEGTTRKSNKIIYPPLLNAKGTQSLARRANLRTAMGPGAFDWDEEQTDKGECLLLRKEKQLIPGCKSCKESGFVKDADYSDFQKSLDNCPDENPPGNILKMKISGSKVMTEDDNDKVPMVSEMNVEKTNLAKELDVDLYVESSGPQLENDKDGRDLADFSDVGFETQLAAEAMEALLHATPNFKASYAHQDLSDSSERSTEGVAVKKLSESSISTNNVSSNSIVTGIRSKRIKRSTKKLNGNVTYALGKCDQYIRKPIPNLAAMKSVKGNDPLTETNLLDVENKVRRRSCRTMSRQKKKSPARNNYKKTVETCTSTKSVQSNSHDGGLLGGNLWNFPISAKRKRCQPSYSTLGSDPDPRKHSEDTFDCIIEFNVSKKRRKATNTSDHVQKKMKSKGDYFKLLPDTSMENTGSNMLKVQVCPDTIRTAGQIKLDGWSYPKKKRTPVSFLRHSNRSDPQFTATEVVDEKNKVHPTGNNKSVERLAGSLLVYTRRGKKGSRTLSNQNTNGQNSSGVNTSASALASGDKEKFSEHSSKVDNIASLHRNKEKFSEHSSKVDNIASLHTVHNSEKMKFDQGLKDDSRASPVYKGNENCNLLGKHKSRPPLTKELIRLGYAESLPDFIPARRRRGVANVLFSQNLDAAMIRQQKKILNRLGFSETSSCSDATHFIADKFVRTRNMLEAIALGKPVVTPSWLESCRQAGYLIDEKSYILRDAKKEKEIGFCMPVSLARASQHPLLHGQRVLVTPNVKPYKDLIHNLVKAVHGEVVQDIRQAGLKYDTISQNILILSCEEDYAMCMPFLEKGTAIYSSELLLNGIIIQKLQYNRHRIFTDCTGKGRSPAAECR